MVIVMEIVAMPVVALAMPFAFLVIAATVLTRVLGLQALVELLFVRAVRGLTQSMGRQLAHVNLARDRRRDQCRAVLPPARDRVTHLSSEQIHR